MKKPRFAKNSRSGANRAIRFESLEVRRLLTTGADFMGLGDLPGGEYGSLARGISDDGQTVVGHSNAVDGRNEPFMWTLNEGMTSLGALPGATAGDSARAASADGNVVVGSSAQKSFRWDNGQMTEIAGDSSTGGYRGAYDVSDNGQIVVGVENGEAYRWEDGTAVGLGDFAGGSFYSVAIALSGDGEVIVGWGTNSADELEPYRWSESSGMESLEFRGFARDVSSDGDVVVGASQTTVTINGTGRGKKGTQTTTQNEAFRWTELGGRQLLGDLPGGTFSSIAYATSADGSLIAGSSSSSSGNQAFVWKQDEGMRSLEDVLTNDFGIGVAGWQLTTVWDVTPDGTTLVGQGINPDGNPEAFFVRFGPPSPGISVSPTAGLLTSEDGGMASFDVALDTQPTADVTIGLMSSDISEGVIDISSLTFYPDNWDTPQLVTLTGVEDADEDGDVAYTVVTATAVSSDPNYSGMDALDVAAINVDNDVVANDPNVLYVYDILFDSKRGGKDWRAVFEIRGDSNADGVGTSSDEVRAGVTVTVVFANQTFTGTTDSNGVFKTDWIRNIGTGHHYANAVDLALSDYNWDPLAFDCEIDRDGDGLPDGLLSI